MKPIDRLHTELTTRLGPGRVLRDVVLAPYTTFRIGGPARLFVEAGSAVELADILRIARTSAVPHFLLGLGANILVGDGGYDGLVVRNRAAAFSLDDGQGPEAGLLTAESGAIVWPDIIQATVAAGWSGLEHFAGIPSTIGGALWQNLHFLSPAPERERTMFIEEVVTGALLLGEDGVERHVDRDWFRFGYDWSTLHETDDIVLSASFQLRKSTPERMDRIVRENLAWRAERHPPLDTEPSAGSIFQKIEGIGAGRLIDECGLKGTRVGGAEITTRHANIMINRGGATARDVRELIDHVIATVEERTGHVLTPEIAFVGTFT
ncbi:MAG: UDP-N-acetylmuramate dehydrogenase [Rhodothermales bacterium]